MDLYLVRHAIAGDRDPEQWPDDRDRPLTPKGIKRFRRAARGLVNLDPDLGILLSSPYERALQTANILHKAGWPEPETLEELAGGDPGALLRALREFRHYESVALVGHEPQLSRFAAAALGATAAPWGEMRKGGVVCLRMATPTFTARAELLSYLPPRVLRRLED